ncbi:MAG: hypothetical protein MGAcid_04070 [uncultured Acidilobus sp. MG]|jgi:hypothetical protein|nr:MAG: hypothetical protein MGAcid_04070 [uncultured Acidilobus sp. MG]
MVTTTFEYLASSLSLSSATLLDMNGDRASTGPPQHEVLLPDLLASETWTRALASRLLDLSHRSRSLA